MKLTLHQKNVLKADLTTHLAKIRDLLEERIDRETATIDYLEAQARAYPVPHVDQFTYHDRLKQTKAVVKELEAERGRTVSMLDRVKRL